HGHEEKRTKAARQDGEPGLQGGIAHQGLQPDGDEDGASVEDEAEDRHKEHTGGVGADFEDTQVHDGVAGHEFADGEREEADDGEDHESDDEARAEPIVFLTFVEHDLQRTHADDEEADAPVVDDIGGAPDVRRIEDEPLRHQRGEQTDRQVDVEDPAPTVAVGDPTAEYRAEHG